MPSVYKIVIATFSLLLSGITHAAIIVVESGDSTTLITSHLGEDRIDIVASDGFKGASINMEVSSGDALVGSSLTEIGRIIFSSAAQGITPDLAYDTFGYYWEPLGFLFNASTDLNYSRWDFDANGTYETVVETDFGVDGNVIDDRFTRYFYDSEGNNLTISDALRPVPEPSASALAIFVCLFALVRRKETRRDL